MHSEFFNSFVYQILKDFNPVRRNFVADRIGNRNLNLKKRFAGFAF